MKWLYAFLLCVPLALSGCGLGSNPLRTARGDYYLLDGYVTAADTAAAKYGSYADCSTSPMPCSKLSVRQRLAQATTDVGHAMDSYSAAVRDPNFTSGDNLQRLEVAVQNALVALNAILGEIGLATAETGMNLKTGGPLQ